MTNGTNPANRMGGIAVATILLAEFIIGTFGNGLVIIAVIISKEVRTTTNVFLVNLAVTDLIVSLLCLLWSIGLILSVSIRTTISLVTPVTYCFFGVILFVCLGVSAFTIASIAFQRCILITKSSQLHQKIFQKKTLIAWTILMWILPGSLVIPHLIFVSQQAVERQFTRCTELHLADTQTYIIVVIAACFFFIPLLATTISYMKIYIFIKNHNLNINRDTFKLSSAINSELQSRSRRTKSKPTVPRRKRELQITKNMFYIVVAFLTCFSPYLICLIILDYDNPILIWTQLLVSVNGCLNPLIYATKHPKFKMLFGLILRCKWKDVPSPTNVLKLFCNIKRKEDLWKT